MVVEPQEFFVHRKVLVQVHLRDNFGDPMVTSATVEVAFISVTNPTTPVWLPTTYAGGGVFEVWHAVSAPGLYRVNATADGADLHSHPLYFATDCMCDCC